MKFNEDCLLNMTMKGQIKGQIYFFGIWIYFFIRMYRKIVVPKIYSCENVDLIYH